MIKICQTNSYLDNAVKISKEAVKELKREQFNSDTLRTLFYDERFKSDKKKEFFVKSRETGEPVKIYIDKFIDKNFKDKNDNNIDFFDIYVYRDIFKKLKIGEKKFIIDNNTFMRKMRAGNMSSDDGCLAGIGIREDQIQIETALNKKISKIPRVSLPDAILYHLKMGFVPKPKLMKINRRNSLNDLMIGIINSVPVIDKNKITPIVVEKRGMFRKRYYLDENTTYALAYLRKIKEELLNKNLLRPTEFKGRAIPMELSGKNLRVWENMLSGKPMFEGVKS